MNTTAMQMNRKTTERMQLAKTEIERGNYLFAHKILKDIDHPVAYKWRRKLDMMLAAPEPKRKSRKGWKIAVIIVLLIIGSIVYADFKRGNDAGQAMLVDAMCQHDLEAYPTTFQYTGCKMHNGRWVIEETK